MGEGLENFKFNTKSSFQNIKLDIESLKIQIQLLQAENRRLREELNKIELNKKISETIPKKEESQKSLKAEKLRLMIENAVSEALKKEYTKALAVLRPVSAETEANDEEQIIQEKATEENPKTTPRKVQNKRVKDKLKEDILKSYERNRKDIIKQQILTEANKAPMTKLELRDLIVNTKKYCSKASFYRYLEELELAGIIIYKRVQKKTVIKPLTVSSRDEQDL